MPVLRMHMRKGPCHIRPRYSRANDRIFIDVAAVIVVNEWVTPGLYKHRTRQQAESGADQKDSPDIRSLRTGRRHHSLHPMTPEIAGRFSNSFTGPFSGSGRLRKPVAWRLTKSPSCSDQLSPYASPLQPYSE